MAFLSVVTRCHPKRPGMMAKNVESLEMQTDQDFEHILIEDDEGRGVGWANAALQWAMPEGEYVLILDDDDMLSTEQAIALLKQAAKDKPGVVVFRAQHDWFGLLPDATVWEKEPKLGHIGSCDFITRQDIWADHIHAFAQERCGDYYFLDSIWQDGPEVVWLDEQLAAVQRISGGAPE